MTRWGAGALLLGLFLAPASCRRTWVADPGPLAVSVFYELESLEPGRRDRVGDFAVLANLYEPLVTTDAQLSLRPALAARWENPDQGSWVFRLQGGVRFHDGRPLTAADVVFSFERLRDDRSLEMRRHVRAVEEVRAVGEQSVLVRTRVPVADFLNRIRFVPVVPKGSTREELEQRANGTGPYRLVSRRGKEELVLARNDLYWGARPSAREVTMRLNRSPAAALADLLSGASDFAQASSKAALEEARRHPELKVRRSSSLSVKMLHFDVSRDRPPSTGGSVNPFRDRRVREAVQLALDRRRLVDELPVPAVPSFQLVPRSVFGYDPSFVPPAPDLARARQLLSAAGWPDGFEATLQTRQTLADGAEAVRRQLAGVGIRLAVRALSEREFYDALGPRGEGFGVALTRVACPTGDAANLLDSALHSPDPALGYGHFNAGGYSSPEVDRLIEEAGRVPEMSKRLSLLHDVLRIAMRDLPFVPLYADEDVTLLRPGLDWQPRLDDYVILEEIVVR